MKKERYRQILIALIGALMCRIGVGGYFPLIPAYYAAALLREEGRALLGGMMFFGMAFSLPVMDTVRYTLGMLIIYLVVRICEWIDHKCLIVTAAVSSAVITVSLSICGDLLTKSIQNDLPLKLMEGIICFAGVYVFSRILDRKSVV